MGMVLIDIAIFTTLFLEGVVTAFCISSALLALGVVSVPITTATTSVWLLLTFYRAEKNGKPSLVQEDIMKAWVKLKNRYAGNQQNSEYANGQKEGELSCNPSQVSC